MTPRWNAQHTNGKQGFQPSRQDNRCLNTPGIHHSSPPHGRQRLHTDGDNTEQPQNGRLAFRGRCALAYCLAFLIYQLGAWLYAEASFGIGQGIALLLLLGLVYLVAKKPYTASK